MLSFKGKNPPTILFCLLLILIIIIIILHKTDFPVSVPFSANRVNDSAAWGALVAAAVCRGVAKVKW